MYNRPQCTLQVSFPMPTATNKSYFSGIAWYYGDNDFITQTFERKKGLGTRRIVTTSHITIVTSPHLTVTRQSLHSHTTVLTNNWLSPLTIILKRVNWAPKTSSLGECRKLWGECEQAMHCGIELCSQDFTSEV